MHPKYRFARTKKKQLILLDFCPSKENHSNFLKLCEMDILKSIEQLQNPMIIAEIIDAVRSAIDKHYHTDSEIIIGIGALIADGYLILVD